MDTLQHLFNTILHIDQQLILFVTQYGTWIYALLFIIIFCETGLVLVPFLPGDSLLFATGTITAASSNSLNIHLMFILLVVASITGNGLNYFLGRKIGASVFSQQQSGLFNKKYLINTNHFYEKFGGKTIVIARFIPIIRTFAPFIAGIAAMSYKKFYFYNILGAVMWIGGLLYVSYWFGNLPFIKMHFSAIILAIIALSLIPPLIELLRQAAKSTAETP